jgi:hypothetical protein
MTTRSPATLLTLAAALALVLIVVDFIGAGLNRSAQVQVNQRQQFINESVEVGRINQTLVHALAVAAVRNGDPELKALLAKQGITVNAAPASAPAPAAASTGDPGTDPR